MNNNEKTGWHVFYKSLNIKRKFFSLFSLKAAV